MRDIEDAFRDESGRLLLSRTAVSEIGARLWADYQEFASRDLSEYDITYLFVDGIAERLRPGQRREPVLAAWGHTSSGAKVLLHLMAGSKEDAETVTAFEAAVTSETVAGVPLTVIWATASGLLTRPTSLRLPGELTTAVLRPRVGGQYAYLRDAYHPIVAFLYGWTLLLVVQTEDHRART